MIPLLIRLRYPEGVIRASSPPLCYVCVSLSKWPCGRTPVPLLPEQEDHNPLPSSPPNSHPSSTLLSRHPQPLPVLIRASPTRLPPDFRQRQKDFLEGIKSSEDRHAASLRKRAVLPMKR